MAAKKRKTTTKARKAAKKPAAKRATSTRKKAAKPKRRPGRPKEPVPTDVIEALLDHIYEHGGSIVSFSKLPGTPARRTLYAWMRKDEEFRAQVQRALEDRGEILAELALEIANDGSADTEEREDKHGNAVTVINHEVIQRSKLRVDQHMRMAACLNKQWSPKAQVEHNAGDNFDALLRRALGIDQASEKGDG